MAAELAADLAEAEADGVSQEEVLGSGAFDARSFAAAWAAERGVGGPSAAKGRVPKRWILLAALAVLVAITASGAVLAIFASPSDSTPASSLRVIVTPGSRSVWVAGSPAEIPRLQTESSGDTRAIGSVLLVVGLAGIVALALSSLGVGPGRWSRGASSTA